MNPLRPDIAAMSPYVPGFQPRDGGRWIKINTNELPYPPSPKVYAAIQRELTADLRKYPEPESRAVREAAARVYGFDPDWIIAANGSDEVLNNLIRACVGAGEELAYVHPSYSYYGTLAAIQGARVRTFGIAADRRIADFPQRYEGKLLFVVQPHAPFGFLYPLAYLEELAGRCAGLLVIDEAYVDFADFTALELVKRLPNVVVTRTFSKSYGLAGMRLGLAFARPEIIAALDTIRDHYNLDRLAQAAAVAALEDQPYLRDCVARVRATREHFSAGLRALGYTVEPSQTNFVFAVPPDRNGGRVAEGLKARRILARHFTDPLLAHGLRLSIGTDEEMAEVLAALQAIG